MVRVDEEERADPSTTLQHAPEIADDVRVRVEDRGHDGERGPVVDRRRQPLRDVARRHVRNFHDFDPFFRDPIELPAQCVKLRVRRDDARTRPKRKRRKETHDEIVRARAERIVAVSIVQESCETSAHPLGLRESVLPFVVDESGRVVEGLELSFERAVGPGLMRMPREQKTFGDAKTGVVRRERVRRCVECGRGHHGQSWLRIAQRSTKSGWFNVVMR